MELECHDNQENEPSEIARILQGSQREDEQVEYETESLSCSPRAAHLRRDSGCGGEIEVASEQ